MADKGVKERGSERDLTWVWILGAVVVVAGFMTWLAVTSEPTQIAVVEEEVAEDQESASLPSLTLEEFGASPGQHVGQRLRVTGVDVASRLGERAFWTQLPNDQPYLIRLTGELQAPAGQPLTVIGTVHPMSDSVLSAWQAEGVLADEMQRTEAEFATTFLEATAAMPASGQGRR